MPRKVSEVVTTQLIGMNEGGLGVGCEEKADSICTPPVRSPLNESRQCWQRCCDVVQQTCCSLKAALKNSLQFCNGADSVFHADDEDEREMESTIEHPG